MADTLRVVRATSLQVDRVSLQVDRLSQEMSAFKDEMRAFKDETRASRIEMNKRWGDLSASLGLLVENVVAPSVPRVLGEVFACSAEDVEFLGVRLKRKHPSLPGRNREFDTLSLTESNTSMLKKATSMA